MKKNVLSILLLFSSPLSFGMDKEVTTNESDTVVKVESPDEDTKKSDKEEVLSGNDGKKDKEEAEGKEDEETPQEVVKEPNEIVSLKKVELKFPQVCFSPGIGDVLIKFISDEQEKMRGAFYRLTLFPVAEAMVVAKKKGVDISLIIDGTHFGDSGDFCAPLLNILSSGGTIYKKSKERNPGNGKFEIMHHKFIIFNKNVGNKKLVWTGSFNPTGQADLKNCENVVILDDHDGIAAFEKEFEEILKLSDLVTEESCFSSKDTKRLSFAREMNHIPQLQP